MGLGNSKYEKEYIKRVRNHSDKVLLASPRSPMEGFEYFNTAEYKNKSNNHKPMIINKLFSGGISNVLPMIKLFSKIISPMMKGRAKGYTDISEYLDTLDQTKELPHEDAKLLENYPNTDLWGDLKAYAWNKWKLIIGFTPLPAELVFKGKAVLFKYALVCVQEMDKEEISHAPELRAGAEVMRVYNSLGNAVNDIAEWLRKEHGVVCQSNHPLGGLTNTTPLAAMAGLGWQGRSGLLITPQFGTRHRIATIFLEEKLFDFTYTDEHCWIEKFCEKCGKCLKSCPSGAIYEKKQTSLKGISFIDETKTCIDREKCFPYFNKTMGCSICIKVCPFSQCEGVYEKLKSNAQRRFLR